jgi:hypothetical protein
MHAHKQKQRGRGRGWSRRGTPGGVGASLLAAKLVAVNSTRLCFVRKLLLQLLLLNTYSTWLQTCIVSLVEIIDKTVLVVFIYCIYSYSTHSDERLPRSIDKGAKKRCCVYF